MEEALFELWQLIVVVVGGGFVLACLLGFPGRDEDNERRYSWEVDDD